MADAHKNFAISTVLTAPSPATSGTSLVLAAGTGTLFPTVPFNVTIWPTGVLPTTANAEIVRVTAISTDTLTITRTQESTSARTIIVGDQIAAAITVKTITDIEVASGKSTILVAASNASVAIKNGADYICTGASDHTTINTALAALPSSKGTVILSSGAFSVSGTINIATSQILKGQGIDSTIITGTATSFTVIHMGNRQASGTMSNFMGLKDLSVASAGGANSFDTVWADGMGIGGFIENVKASEGNYNFRLTDLDQCYTKGIKGYNPRTASIFCEIGLENTWGTVAFYSPSMALSDNSSTCLLIDASAAQVSPNKLDRLTIYGALFYSTVGLTSTTGIKTTVGATSFAIHGSLFENTVRHVDLVGQTFMSFNNCSFIQNSGVSTDIIRYQTNNHTTTFSDCRFQQATNAFNGASGSSALCFLGHNTNQGNITNLFTGSFGNKQGTDTVFTGSGSLAAGLDNQPFDWVFTNKIRVESPSVPATASASGDVGTVAWDSGYIYICTASNTWKRVAIATW